ncbi:MAG: Tim44 domain-containing protein [Thermodesulfobacteriota bacterium]
MLDQFRSLTPFLLILIAAAFIEGGIMADYADARSRGGGRSFRRTAPKQPVTRQAPAKTTTQSTKQKSGFGRGLMGGLLGGALGGLLFGSLFGMGGNGFGILPLLILAGLGFYFYRRLSKPQAGPGYQRPPGPQNQGFGSAGVGGMGTPPPPPAMDPVEEGLAMIRQADPGFDEKYFVEITSDVFFKIQAGWMRREIESFRHLLGEQLASEYEDHFAELRQLGRLNKLENISIRQVKIIGAGSTEGGEDFITVLFTANLLDYTVDEHSGDLIEGSMTEPVKFAEEWTWARPVGTEDWKLEGIEVMEG